MSSSPDFFGPPTPGHQTFVRSSQHLDGPPAASAPADPFVRLLSDEGGTVAIEYGMIAAFIVIVIFTAVVNLGTVVTAMWAAAAAIF